MNSDTSAEQVDRESLNEEIHKDTFELDTMNQSDRQRFRAILDRIPTSAGRVLDIGCVRHDSSRRNEGNLHDLISAHIEGDLIGIDIVEEEIRQMAEAGYNVRVDDAERLETVSESVDVIVAGEVIEHLSNQGLFLESARDNLADDGKIVLTTPNPDGFVFWRKAVTGDTNNETHTCWIDPANLKRLVSLVGGLEVSEWAYLPPQGGISGKLWKGGLRRGASPGYIATIERTENA